jgi:hypothetical protein
MSPRVAHLDYLHSYEKASSISSPPLRTAEEHDPQCQGSTLTISSDALNFHSLQGAKVELKMLLIGHVVLHEVLKALLAARREAREPQRIKVILGGHDLQGRRHCIERHGPEEALFR